MEKEIKSRTASDVIISLENKIDYLMQMHKNLDLNVKIISNKLSHMINALTVLPNDLNHNSISPDPVSIATAPPSFQENDFKQLKIKEEFSLPKEMGLPVEASPVGFRRTSRPETYSSPESNQKNIPTPSVPQPEMHAPKFEQSSTIHISSTANRIPVIQRIVDKNGKSIFMAEVEIINNQSNIVEMKTRTSGVGKWQATLLPGEYKITIRKREALNKQNIEAVQNISIDNSTPAELPMLICK